MHGARNPQRGVGGLSSLPCRLAEVSLRRHADALSLHAGSPCFRVRLARSACPCTPCDPGGCFPPDRDQTASLHPRMPSQSAPYASSDGIPSRAEVRGDDRCFHKSRHTSRTEPVVVFLALSATANRLPLASAFCHVLWPLTVMGSQWVAFASVARSALARFQSPFALYERSRGRPYGIAAVFHH